MYFMEAYCQYFKQVKKFKTIEINDKLRFLEFLFNLSKFNLLVIKCGKDHFNSTPILS